MCYEQEMSVRSKLFDGLVNSRIKSIAMFAGLIFLGVQIIGSTPASSATLGSPSHLRLLDRLDRPEDGYCLDIPGVPPDIRIELPLFAHNCKTSLTMDTTVVFTSDGYIRFPDAELCVTVMGIHSSLPGASIRLEECNPPNPFIDVSKLQRFDLHEDGRLTLKGTDLCVTVGSRSAKTLSAVHRWRTVFVDDCAVAKPARSRWEFIVPHG